MEGFPKRAQVTGLSVVYGIGVSVFGGFAQFSVTLLISTTGNPMSPAWYMVTCTVISLGALTALKEHRRLVSVVVNAEAPTALANEVIAGRVGASNVLTDTKGMMDSEDFAWMSDAVPGCYVVIGNGVGEWGGWRVHNPKYDFNDRIISLGASYWVRLVETYLK